MSKTFILHDESVNTYGFRMLTSGANLEEFRKNPVMLLNHDDWKLPIGRWENIRIENGKILADAVFDEKDTRAVEVMDKVENDFIRMASIGAWPPEQVSDAYDLKMPGQTGPTVVRWTVREASIVTIGANHNALAFYDKDGNVINLKDRSVLVKLMDKSINYQNKRTMGKLTEILKLGDQANEEQIASKVNELIANNDRLAKENKTLTELVDQQKAAEKTRQQAEAVALVDAAIKDGRIDAKGRESYIALFDRDFEGAKLALSAISPRQSVTEQIHAAGTTVDLGDWKNKGWDELDKAGKLMQLKDHYPDLYKEKFKERFGKEPQM